MALHEICGWCIMHGPACLSRWCGCMHTPVWLPEQHSCTLGTLRDATVAACTVPDKATASSGQVSSRGSGSDCGCVQGPAPSPAAYDDGLVEVYGLKMGALKQGWNVRQVESHTRRLGQGCGLRLYIAADDTQEHSIYTLMDGEDWWQRVPGSKAGASIKDGLLVRLLAALLRGCLLAAVCGLLCVGCCLLAAACWLLPVGCCVWAAAPHERATCPGGNALRSGALAHCGCMHAV
jgi:hypothetical protein